MRNFTLFASSLLLSISAAASPAVMSAQTHRSTTLLGHNEPSAAEKSQIEKLRQTGHTLLKSPQTSDRSQANALRRAPGAAVAAKLPVPTNEIISETPEGTLTDWSRNCMGYYDFFGYLIMVEVKGCVQQMVDAGDAVYLNIVTSQFPLDSWVKGEKDADGNITIPAGQMVYKEYYEGNVYDFCMVPVTYAFEKDGDGEEVLQYYYHDSMKLNLVDGKYVADNPDMIMGLCEYYDENQSYYWTGYGDGELSLSPVTDTPMEMPSNLAAEKWAALTDDGGYFVQVALDGSKVYVGGMIYSNPDA
ncbi:MAG: hypothetical protein K2I56_02250, partial [Muribaculaceae bacterium]|nr:hypothetical protein [Muribaculaceae bacterium]